MGTARDFDLYSILAISHGLPSDWETYRAIAEFLTGHPMPGPAHALGIRDICGPWLIEQHPALGDVPPYPHFDTEQEMDDWAEQQAHHIGAHTLPVLPLPADRPCPPFIERLLDRADPTTVYHHNPNPQADL